MKFRGSFSRKFRVFSSWNCRWLLSPNLFTWIFCKIYRFFSVPSTDFLWHLHVWVNLTENLKKKKCCQQIFKCITLFSLCEFLTNFQLNFTDWNRQKWFTVKAVEIGWSNYRKFNFENILLQAKKSSSLAQEKYFPTKCTLFQIKQMGFELKKLCWNQWNSIKMLTKFLFVKQNGLRKFDWKRIKVCRNQWNLFSNQMNK